MAQGLAERLRERLAVGEDAPSAAGLAYAADFVRLLRRVAGIEATDAAGLRASLDAVVAPATGLTEAQRLALYELACLPDHRDLDDAREQAAFTGRFRGGRPVLQEVAAGEVGVETFAATWGPGRAVQLVDAALVVLAGRGAPPSQVRRCFEAAEHLGVDPLSMAALARQRDPRFGADGLRLQWDAAAMGPGAAVSIGESPGAELCIPDPHVLPVHARLMQTASGLRITGAEERPLIVNGKVTQSAPFGPGDTARLGPWALRYDGTSLEARSERTFSTFAVRNLRRAIGPTTLLDDVSFTAYAGEVVAFVGPSGCGKTTLMSALAGTAPPDSGEVLLDGEPFHALLERDRSRAGVVPQDDIVHPELTVEESLTFSARLRLGAGADDQAVRVEVERVLEELGIAHIRASRIGDALRRGISGGQRKRVNLGQELLTRTTRVLFLDEPTSGLDPHSSQSIVRLARVLADRGRTIFIVTHDLSPQVVGLVDHLVVLAPGGRLLFYGPPDAACRYFKVRTVDAIFSRIADYSAAMYRETPEHAAWVVGREAVRTSGVLPAPPPPTPAAAESSLGRAWRQFRVLVARYARVKARDRTGLWVLAAQPPFLALVMALVFPAPTMQMLFMLSLSCTWFGMSVAVRELIADRVIWRRERRVGVGVAPYVSSKLAVLVGIVVLQCAFLSGIVWMTHDLGAHGFGLVSTLGVSALTGIAGTCLGLCVSSLFGSSEAAVGTLPLLLIPQITFSSLLIGLRDMTPLARSLTWLDPQRYAFDALLKVGSTLSEATRARGWDTVENTVPLYQLGLKGAEIDDMGLPMRTLCLALVGWSLLFASAAYVRTHLRRDD
ncbi:MAG: hypothetical protein RLZZ299_1357 [Pseudomonadota bacterium]